MLRRAIDRRTDNLHLRTKFLTLLHGSPEALTEANVGEERIRFPKTTCKKLSKVCDYIRRQFLDAQCLSISTLSLTQWQKLPTSRHRDQKRDFLLVLPGELLVVAWPLVPRGQQRQQVHHLAHQAQHATRHLDI